MLSVAEVPCTAEAASSGLAATPVPDATHGAEALPAAADGVPSCARAGKLAAAHSTAAHTARWEAVRQWAPGRGLDEKKGKPGSKREIVNVF